MRTSPAANCSIPGEDCCTSGTRGVQSQISAAIPYLTRGGRVGEGGWMHSALAVVIMTSNVLSPGSGSGCFSLRSYRVRPSIPCRSWCSLERLPYGTNESSMSLIHRCLAAHTGAEDRCNERDWMREGRSLESVTVCARITEPRRSAGDGRPYQELGSRASRQSTSQVARCPTGQIQVQAGNVARRSVQMWCSK
jgi:hypothetical protein